MPTITDLTGPAGFLEAVLDPGAAHGHRRAACRGRLRASAPAVRRDDAHEGRVPGREGTGEDRLRGAAVQLPRRRASAGDVTTGEGEMADFRAALDYMAAVTPVRRCGPRVSRSARGSRWRPAPWIRACRS